MSIRQARPDDHLALKALWMAAFHDSPEATDFYFSHRHRDEWMLVDQQHGRIRGMLTALPIELCSQGKCKKARYFFAIATDEQDRGQGVSSQLMLEAERLAREAGCAASLLVPANAPLFQFYDKRGYQPCFSYRLLTVSANALPAPAGQARIYVPTAQRMLALRDEAYAASRLYARWDAQALDYVRHAAQVYEAALLTFDQGPAKGYVYGEWEGDALTIKDMALVGIAPLDAMALLHQKLGAAAYHLRLPADSAWGDSRPYGLIKAFEPLDMEGGAPYLALGKD